ncbi:MAG: ribbon-helix-helix domain-containing protein [Nanoarchaeota archaeon]|nr:ribbon-helix-helix domain-containing protein [Nanoarchaeota archaeon]
MRVKLSISVDDKVLSKIDELVELGIFRNRSHAVDFSISFFNGGARDGR